MPIFTRPDDLSEIDVQKILDETFNMSAPFDVPIVVIASEEFDHCADRSTRLVRFSRDEMNKVIETRLQDFVAANSDVFAPDVANEIVSEYMENTKYLLEVVAKNLILPDEYASGCVAYPFKGLQGPFAHQKGEEYKDSLSSIILTLPENVTGASYAASNIGVAQGELPELPGSSEEWRLLIAWHEISHTSGAAEMQADKMASIVTRQALGRNGIIQAHADQRIVTAVMNHFEDVQTSYYGWPLTEAIDEVAAMGQAEIDAFSAAEIKDVRFEQPDFKSDKVISLGQRLRDVFPQVFENMEKKIEPMKLRDLMNLKAQTDSFIAEGTFDDDPEEGQIAARFSLALSRLTVGKSAYQP